ncbi:MAG: 2-dehydro-3-deoxyphosphogluconate aldolase / (4S)-4-hydroxy-2-oxoglutarate aldolase [Chloroflexota bacterium]|nr:2-dehydro-3-deoxyphosphogluconate aldolase / (4S)-4-hydroxy-2-oxoglutarate aldolase [Chloroflexota bacterium]
MTPDERREAGRLVDDLAAERLIAIIRAGQAVDIERIAEILLTGRVRFIEVTLTTPGAIEAIAALQPFRAEGMRVGAGTVLTGADARSAIEAGVDFLVSPTVEPDVVAAGRGAHCAAFIGGLTPTEILAAWRAGADVVKVFPGRVATPGYFADLAGPLPGIPLMPTGNVDLETAPAYLRAGAIAVGVGKALVNPEHLAERRFDAIRSDVARWRQLVDEAVVVAP